MAASKRSHERGPSLSLRPHKAARIIPSNNNAPTSPEESRMSLDDNTIPSNNVVPPNPQTLWENLQMISTSEPLVVPPLKFLGRLVRPLTSFDISGITAWPSSLGAIKGEFRYNLTPQQGHRLPTNVLNLTAWRRMKAFPPHQTPPDSFIRPPYLHLGSSAWLNIDVFVFLPRLSLTACQNQDPGRIQEHVLETWTDRVFLPALHENNQNNNSSISTSISNGSINTIRTPSSFRTSKLNSHSPTWYNPTIAPYPTYIIQNNNNNNNLLSTTWEKLQQNSLSIPDFQDPFLVMYTDKRLSGMFTGGNPEIVFQDFERAWMEEIDTRYVPLDGDNLKISISCDVVV